MTTGTLAGVTQASSFLDGFDDDPLQEGIPTMKAGIEGAIDLLHRNLAAWDDEEASVKEEHEELINDLRIFLEGK